MTKIVCNPFVYRQTPDSSFSHFAGSWEALEALAEEGFKNAKPGYKDGVLLIPVSQRDFFTGVVKVTRDTQLVATFKARREGELPFIDVTARGPKTAAARVHLVVYSKAVLGADASAIPADYEIVSINADYMRMGDPLAPTSEPMTPMAMARNFLELPGGTKAEYTAQEFAESIAFWLGGHAMRHE